MELLVPEQVHEGDVRGCGITPPCYADIPDGLQRSQDYWQRWLWGSVWMQEGRFWKDVSYNQATENHKWCCPCKGVGPMFLNFLPHKQVCSQASRQEENQSKEGRTAGSQREEYAGKGRGGGGGGMGAG